MGMHKDAQHSPEQPLKASEWVRVGKDFTRGVKRHCSFLVWTEGEGSLAFWSPGWIEETYMTAV